MRYNSVLDLHTHTVASGHAYCSLREMAKAASEKGLEVLGITEHAPMMPGTCHKYYFDNLKVVPREMYGIQLLLGSEVNILDAQGSVDLSERTLSKMDVVVASLHIPCMKPASKLENTEGYLNVMKNPYVNIIGHPDDGRFPVDYEQLVLGAKKHHVLLEVNNNSLDPRCTRENGEENVKDMLCYCKKYEVPEVFCTAWLDNGAETPVDAILPGAALFAHLGFHEEFDEAALEDEFQDAVGSSLKEFLKLDKFDQLFLGDQANMKSENPSKYLLYQDALLGIFDYHLKDAGVSEYYKKLAEELKNSAEICKNHAKFFGYYHCLAEVLAQKADLGSEIKAAYDAHDLSTLSRICEEIIPHLTENLWKLKELREDLWMADAKPFGYELIDLRMGGVITRLDSTRRRLHSYVEGKISRLEELETERIQYFAEGEPAIENHWQRAVSGADFTDTI